ncbi:hypothetical protein ABZ705_22965, partial [Streptomyces sp. NPDC006984]|uniref:hypothetical protein n=1 Tax=Streptomyces sp. NPDC006984 TaxID=3155463 RepID=UPI0033F2972B
CWKRRELPSSQVTGHFLVPGNITAAHQPVDPGSGTHPGATLNNFERHLRQRVDDLEAEMEAGERTAQTAVVNKPLSGPLADPKRQRAFRRLQDSGLRSVTRTVAFSGIHPG